MAALTLTAVLPEYANEIMRIGYDIGQSRVIVGFHYQSDVDAARLAASATFARLCAEKSFFEAIEKARKEVKTIKWRVKSEEWKIWITNSSMDLMVEEALKELIRRDLSQIHIPKGGNSH